MGAGYTQQTRGILHGAVNQGCPIHQKIGVARKARLKIDHDDAGSFAETDRHRLAAPIPQGIEHQLLLARLTPSGTTETNRKTAVTARITVRSAVIVRRWTRVREIQSGPMIQGSIKIRGVKVADIDVSNVQTPTPNACPTFRRRTVSPFDPTDFDAPAQGRPSRRENPGGSHDERLSRVAQLRGSDPLHRSSAHLKSDHFANGMGDHFALEWPITFKWNR